MKRKMLPLIIMLTAGAVVGIVTYIMHYDLYDYFFRFLLPTGLGNIIGGTGVFTLLVSAQVRSENGKQLD